jgi:signal transduction histidine kinase
MDLLPGLARCLLRHARTGTNGTERFGTERSTVTMSTLKPDAPSVSAPLAVSEPQPPAPRASILLVDDQPARLLSYEAILLGLGVQCVRALSGAQALERLLEREFAAILLDVHMPGMDGFEVARLVREHPRMERTPIIFVTAVNVSELDRLKGYELGAIDYIAVPVVPEILRSKVAVLVELHQRRGQLQALNAALSDARAKLDAEHQQALAERDAQLQAALEHSDRRKDEFLAMLAHELRNPVAPIATAAELLSRLVSHENQQTLVGIIQRQAVHLGRLLDDLLDVARITQGRIELQREVLDVGACIQLAIDTAEPLIRSKAHRLTVTQTLGPIYVSADKARLGQCMANVLANAAKYTPEGGEICIRSYLDGHHVVVDIQDNGIGIAPEFLPRIFDLFTQAERGLDRSQGGLGVGLTVCKQIIEMHGGTIAASSPGWDRGATFTMRIPAAERPMAAAAATPETFGSLLRVLIVDDNRDAADSLAMLLQFEGRQVLCAYSGEAALQQVAAFEPQAVLLDIGLPGFDGYEVARRLKADFPKLRVIALSGYGQVEDRQRSAAAGFDGHLVKPVDLDALKRALLPA